VILFFEHFRYRSDMKKILAVLPLVVLIGFFATSDPLFGAPKKKATPPPVKAPTISSVTATSITVAEEKTTKTLTINQFTEITVNGQKATAADLKPGMTVNVTLGTDPSKASRISATGK
jgi:hypothetical protein